MSWAIAQSTSIQHKRRELPLPSYTLKTKASPELEPKTYDNHDYPHR
jgi:hypothetical protein